MAGNEENCNKKYKTTYTTEHGFQYERKIAILIALKLYQGKEIFEIATNYRDADNFDDIVFTVKKKTKSEGRTFLMQLKHKHLNKITKKQLVYDDLITKNTNKEETNKDKEKEAFWLDKYFKTFLKISGKSDKVISRNNKTFIIFTNAIAADDLLSNSSLDNASNYLKWTSESESGKVLKINPKKVKINELFLYENKTEEILCFLSKLYIYTDQVCLEDVDGLINEELRLINKNLSEHEINLLRSSLDANFQQAYHQGIIIDKSFIKEITGRFSEFSQLPLFANNFLSNDLSVCFTGGNIDNVSAKMIIAIVNSQKNTNPNEFDIKLKLKNHYQLFNKYFNIGELQKYKGKFVNISLQATFSESDLKLLNHKVKENKSDLEVNSIFFNNKTQKFTEPIIHEYFVASYFIQNFDNEKQFLIKKKYLSHWQYAKNFLDNYLVGNFELHKAVYYDDMDKVEEIISTSQSDINSVDKIGRTVLHISAASPKGKKFVKYLLSHGARRDIDDSLQRSALLMALDAKVLESINLLLEKDTDLSYAEIINIDTFYEAFAGDLENVMRFLVKNGIQKKINFQSIPVKMKESKKKSKTCTGIQLAVIKNSPKILEFFLQEKKGIFKDFDINVRDTDKNTPILKAAFKGYTDVMKVLVKHEADLRCFNIDENELSHAAVISKNILTIIYTRELGLEFDSKNKENKTAIELIKNENIDLKIINECIERNGFGKIIE